jgi:Protein of unknown function (DUF3089)
MTLCARRPPCGTCGGISSASELDQEGWNGADPKEAPREEAVSTRSVRCSRLRTVPLVALAGLALAVSLAAAPVTPLAAAAGASTPAASHTVWLCRPGQADDPCTANLADTSVTASGSTTVTTAHPAAASKFDCFYVYPTVSAQTTPNANLQIQTTETATAMEQASRFSQDCRVWAPMYRQRTVASLFKNDPEANQVAYASLLSGWKDYLAHYNHGRPIVFIGHSQGAAMLIRLLRQEIDPNPALRKLMVSAIILGGNVTVPVGKDVGGSFSHIPTCGSPQQTGCVIAYSSFGSTPPNPSLFGRPGTGVSSLSDQTASKGLQVVCVNPVTFSSAVGPLQPYFLSATSSVPGVKVSTPWVSYPGLYTAQCQSVGGATSLQVIPTGVAGDPRPKVTASLGPLWGYHLDDVNLALGNLVSDVAREEAAFHG